MMPKRIFLICFLINISLCAENDKAPRPNVNPLANNAIAGNQINLNPILNLLRKILFILENNDNDISEILSLMQQMLTEFTNQENLIEQNYTETLLATSLLQSVISLLEQQNSTLNTESLMQLLTAILSMVTQTQQTTQDLITTTSANSNSIETNNLLNIILSILISQQAQIDSLKNDTATRFNAIETNLQSITAQSALQESQLQDIMNTLANVQTDVITTLTTLQAHI